MSEDNKYKLDRGFFPPPHLNTYKVPWKTNISAVEILSIPQAIVNIVIMI